MRIESCDVWMRGDWIVDKVMNDRDRYSVKVKLLNVLEFIEEWG